MSLKLFRFQMRRVYLRTLTARMSDELELEFVVL
jgi:hypothetical protein